MTRCTYVPQHLMLLFAAVVALFHLTLQNQADICQSNGPPRYEFYPNVTSRSSFIQCLNSSGNYVAVPYVCPDGLAFIPRTSRNDLSPLCGSKRTTFDCSRQQNGNGSYSGDRSLYVSCVDGNPRDLYQCPLGEYLDETSLTCQLSCLFKRSVGSFPTEDGGYYTCTFDLKTLKWTLSIHACQSNTKYNPSLQFCLRTTSPSGNDVDPSGSTTTSDETVATSTSGETAVTNPTSDETTGTTTPTNIPDPSASYTTSQSSTIPWQQTISR